MICILCVKPSNAFLKIFQDEGISLGISEIISKHFWLQPNSDDVNANVICTSCWSMLSNFHVFYLQVEAAHICLQQINTCIGDQPMPENPVDSIATEIKLEAGDTEQSLTTFTVFEVQECADETQTTDQDDSKYIPPTVTHPFIDIVYGEGNSYSTTMPIDNERRSFTSGCEDDDDETACKGVKSTAKINKSEQNTKIKNAVNQIKMDDRDRLISNFIKLSCDICHGKVSTFTALMTHYRVTHQQTGHVSCCGTIIRKRCHLIDHIKKHQNPEYFKCEMCAIVFSSRKNLNRHMQSHKKKDQRERKHRCDQCNLSFYTKYHLTRHINLHI